MPLLQLQKAQDILLFLGDGKTIEELEGTPAGTWDDINDAQTPSWGTIDTSQPCK